MISTACPGAPTLGVGKIVAVGRNYVDHAREMGGDAATPPVLFLKPPSALVLGGGTVALPAFSREVHHEIELVVRIATGGARLSPDAAAHAVDACGVGLDLTARDLQQEARRRGDPWAVAKGFDGSAPLSPLAPLADLAALSGCELVLTVGGETRQRARVDRMSLGVAPLLVWISSRFRLEPGDLVFTGTPAGVGPVRAGDVAVAELVGPAGAPRARLQVSFVAAAAE